MSFLDILNPFKLVSDIIKFYTLFGIWPFLFMGFAGYISFQTWNKMTSSYDQNGKERITLKSLLGAFLIIVILTTAIFAFVFKYVLKP